MQIVHVNSDNLEEIIQTATAVLKAGGLVVYPTETTYGIGADAENKVAIAKLIAYKSKRDGKPISVAVDSQKMAEKYVILNQTAKSLYKTFLPGPVTIISKSTGKVAPGVASQTDAVGIRIPNYNLVLKLIFAFGKGITATGANASYQKRPYTIQDIFDNISDKQKSLIDLVIDAGELPKNEPSTVIDTTLDDIVVTRFGDQHFTNTEKLLSNSPAETEKIAAELISRYRSKLGYKPLILALSGQMGAGKTHFTKGIASGLSIQDTISSPTYALANEYTFSHENRDCLLVHIDTWKMESIEQFTELDFKHYFKQNALIVIEWADKFVDQIKAFESQAQVVWISLLILNDSERQIEIAHN